MASSAYPLSWCPTWSDYRAKIEEWVAEGQKTGASLLVFPEYALMELAAFEGEAAAGDKFGSLEAASRHFEKAVDLWSEIAVKYQVHILAGTGPFPFKNTYVNKAVLVAPTGAVGLQDKQIPTRLERDVWEIVGGDPLALFDTALGKIGILTCYDAEFPLLGRAVSEAEIILAPSCTAEESGYWRVRIGAMARALETQCVSVHSSLLGPAPQFFAVDRGTGVGGIFGPPDLGFPSNGVLAVGTLNTPGWTVAEVDLAAVENVRRDGTVLNRTHWTEQSGENAAHVTALR